MKKKIDFLKPFDENTPLSVTLSLHFYSFCYFGIGRVNIIDFRKVGQKRLRNEDKVGQKFIQKRGKSRAVKFGKEDKMGQKSDYFIKCYQRLTSYIFIFEP